MSFKIVFIGLKMFYNIFYYTSTIISLILHSLLLCCNLASVGIPYFTLILFIICVASKFFKLPSPSEKLLSSLLGRDVDDISYWPIANRGGAYDSPENSMASIKNCINRGIRNILLDADITLDGEIVLVHPRTLEKAGFKDIKHNTWEKIQNINVSDLHPLGQKFGEENIMLLKSLLEFLEESTVTIFLLISDNSAKMIDRLKKFIMDNHKFSERIILCSKSPLAIYQLRKTHLELVCGLWIEQSPKKLILKSSTLLSSIYGAVLRNIITQVIGISIVFINKDEYNLQISELWRNVGVRPVVYKVNSPNEKRYFQKVMKTQYLTDSLRSEPQLLLIRGASESKNFANENQSS